MTTIEKDRLEWLEQMTLESGGHSSVDEGACLLEASAYLAGEPFTDHPQCVSPILGAFGRAWNDALDDEGRQQLKPYAAKLIGTADGRDEGRAWMLTDWLVRVCAPAWLELAGVEESPAALRALLPVTATTVGEATPAAQAGREKAYAAWDAAGAAARDAAGAAARAAAGAAAWDAAGSYDERYAIARKAADEKVQPVKVELQATARDLLDRMIALGKEAS